MSTPASLNACAAFYAAQHGRSAGPLDAARIHTVQHATAADLCSRDVPTCDAGMPVREAARLMRNRHAGAIVVVQERPPLAPLVAGIVTHRDLTTAIAGSDEQAPALKVADIMTRDVVSARAGDPAHGVLTVMQRERIRRMPVIGQDDELVGVVALEDVVAALGAQVQALAAAVEAVRRRQA